MRPVFLDAGAIDGVRLLRPETFALMTTNCSTAAQRAETEMNGWPLFAEGHGFGMGVAVVIESEKAMPMPCGGGVGSVGWPGGFGGWWRADPRDNSVLIFLSHNMVQLEQRANGIGLGVYAAITQFQALASASPA